MRSIFDDSGINQKYYSNYFYPIGNRVSIIDKPKKSFSKLATNGKLGVLIGYNDELLSYRVLSDEGKIISTKHLKFLDYSNVKDYNLGRKLTIGNDEDDLITLEESVIDPEELTEEIEIFESVESSSEAENNDVSASLVPISIPEPQSDRQTLRESMKTLMN
ncbi:hypothetical protein VP01_281g4 [Puccinia sorghi]|uniref:Uncharacterized protein n=1 Tax=Puccinia sorghi TaxID=27349 RepID=A0A0L6V331_9BASI|nr:hypothetical protein VP01_281g4 [Puccinia sorghi]